ncbi:HTH-type transcriptional regulator HmrR [compost metagenome]
MGFSIEQVRTLLSLWRDRSRLDDEVRTLALTYIEALNARITALQAMREAVMHLASTCDSGDVSSGTGT